MFQIAECKWHRKYCCKFLRKFENRNLEIKGTVFWGLDFEMAAFLLFQNRSIFGTLRIAGDRVITACQGFEESLQGLCFGTWDGGGLGVTYSHDMTTHDLHRAGSVLPLLRIWYSASTVSYSGPLGTRLPCSAAAQLQEGQHPPIAKINLANAWNCNAWIAMPGWLRNRTGTGNRNRRNRFSRNRKRNRNRRNRCPGTEAGTGTVLPC